MNEIIYCIAQHPQRSMKTEHIVKILKTPKKTNEICLKRLFSFQENDR